MCLLNADRADSLRMPSRTSAAVSLRTLRPERCPPLKLFTNDLSPRAWLGACRRCRLARRDGRLRRRLSRRGLGGRRHVAGLNTRHLSAVWIHQRRHGRHVGDQDQLSADQHQRNHDRAEKSASDRDPVRCPRRVLTGSPPCLDEAPLAHAAPTAARCGPRTLLRDSCAWCSSTPPPAPASDGSGGADGRRSPSTLFH